MPTDLLIPGRTCWTVEHARAAGVFIDGQAYFEAFARAALTAERQIFISGWQFDTTVELLRGDAARDFPGPTAFLPFLKFLCERRPDLEIFVLAWDFSVVFGMDRQWLQKRMFAWQGHPRIHFVFDSRHPVGACQHQKLVIVDGHWAFTGGMDLCSSRWDVSGTTGRTFASTRTENRIRRSTTCRRSWKGRRRRSSRGGSSASGAAPRSVRFRTRRSSLRKGSVPSSRP